MSDTLRTGNAALARGAWEAGVRIGTGYPGTPSTDILESLAQYEGVYCEWAPNEKVALEVAFGASLAGARALVTMKHVGLNVAADPFFSGAYLGVNGGLVIVSADDPGMHSSQNEQDNRWFALVARIPLLEPSTPEECRVFMRRAFELSERFDTPVLLRTTTTLSHGRSGTRDGERCLHQPRDYRKNARKNVLLPAHARARHRLIEEQRIPLLAAQSEQWTEISIGSADIPIITSGPAWLLAREAYPGATILKLGMTHPLPERLIREFAGEREVVIVEELEPFLEQQIRALGVKCQARTWPRHGELTVGALRSSERKQPAAASTPLPVRAPALCAGCPHRGVFHTLAQLGTTVIGDIGCYTLGALPPLSAMDSCLNMGASIGMAHGFAKVAGQQPVVAVIGDSTFFHSGITGLLNIVYNGSATTVIVLDNRTTAMTGAQGHPGTGERLSGDTTQAVDIEGIARAVGVRDVRTIDPYDLPSMRAAITDAIANDQPTVLIARAPCVLNERVRLGPPVTVDAARCGDCQACAQLGCPALGLRDGRPSIDPLLCNGCGLCQQLCTGCLAGTDWRLATDLVGQQRMTEAVDVVLRTNPLPATTARICPHPCEQPVNPLGGTQWWAASPRCTEQLIGDFALEHPPQFAAVQPLGRSVAMIGSGPAGLSAAWQLRRHGCDVVILEQDDAPGGMLRHGIPEFRLPRQVLDGEIARLRTAGVQFRCGVRIGTVTEFARLRDKFDAVVVAAGHSRARPLDVPGDPQTTVLAGLEFLRQYNAGQGPAVGARVGVIGGGNTAVDCARAAVRMGAQTTVLYRRSEQQLRAIPDEVEQARSEGVRFEFNRPPSRDGFDTVIAAIGEELDFDFGFDGNLKTTFAGATAERGVFACGDAAFGYGTVAQAIASGRKVAAAVLEYLATLPAANRKTL
jgi:indolepyruvate ferredoxin oxidoreductase alpha subunit